jgi:hypothetical protein
LLAGGEPNATFRLDRFLTEDAKPVGLSRVAKFLAGTVN